MSLRRHWAAVFRLEPQREAHAGRTMENTCPCRCCYSMWDACKLQWSVLIGLFRSRASLEGEILAKFILSVSATFSFCMSAAAQTNLQTTPLQATQQEQLLAQQQGQIARTGLSQDQIREVQRDLLQNGYYAGPVDGTFGPKTEHALREFQKAQQVPVTGQIGGLSRDQIREVQRALLQKGYDAGPEDGSFGLRTARALRQFQKAQQLPVTGQLDDRSLAALQIGQRKAGEEKSTGPQEAPTQSASTPQDTSIRGSPPSGDGSGNQAMTSGQSSPGNQPRTLQEPAPEEPKRSWWRSLRERLWR